MTVYQFFRRNLLWRHGRELLGVAAVLLMIGLLYSTLMGIFGLLLCLFGLFFYRNPKRVRPDVAQNVLLSPADGTVISISESADKRHTVLAIFLSPINVHVNWIPCDGTISGITHRPGARYPAFVSKSSSLNEAAMLQLHSAAGPNIVVRQIAGVLARRIVCWVSPGQKVDAGQSYGMIKFGSRVELFVPKDATLFVSVGQAVYGVLTPLAELTM